jgi:hypothetical protein
MSDQLYKMITLLGIHAAIAGGVFPHLNRVWCRTCGRSEQIDPAACLAHGWPKCCNATMTIDQPANVEPCQGVKP